MDHEAMVRTDLTPDLESEGQMLTEKLEQVYSVKALFWMLDADTSIWRLVIAVKEYPQLGPIAIYKKIRSIISRNQDSFPSLTIDDIYLDHPDSQAVNDMRRLFKVKGKGRLRIAQTVINGSLIEGALVYRLSR